MNDNCLLNSRSAAPPLTLFTGLPGVFAQRGRFPISRVSYMCSSFGFMENEYNCVYIDFFSHSYQFIIHISPLGFTEGLKFYFPTNQKHPNFLITYQAS